MAPDRPVSDDPTPLLIDEIQCTGTVASHQDRGRQKPKTRTVLANRLSAFSPDERGFRIARGPCRRVERNVNHQAIGSQNKETDLNGPQDRVEGFLVGRELIIRKSLDELLRITHVLKDILDGINGYVSSKGWYSRILRR